MKLFLEASLGAVIVLIIQLLARSENYFISGLVPLFPTFTLITHYIVGTQRSTLELKQTILFGFFSMIPFLLYMISLYFLVDRWELRYALPGATLIWTLSAALLVLLWPR